MSRWPGWLIAPALVTTAAPAFGHSPIEGIDSFFNGVLHPVFVPAHFLLLMALGLYLGQRGARNNQRPLLVFVIASVAGLVLAWFAIGSGMEKLLLGLTLLLGLLIAANLGPGIAFSVLIAAVAGLLIGMDSTQESLAGMDRFVSLFGTGVAIYFLILYPIAIAEWAVGRTWEKIGIRIAGSWIAAAALMVLVLSMYGAA